MCETTQLGIFNSLHPARALKKELTVLIYVLCTYSKRDCMKRCVDMTDWTDSSVITIFSTNSKSAFLDKNSRTYFAKNPVEVTTYLHYRLKTLKW